ncbi:2'-5' RNA ligase family protein [Modestobacter sp. DSM 44400]|uniref:2'-5' RNA ligase family protein n=1 Tax=Modestobacter sp. DSM 44400 TaxID=1550230 RepID=UPI001587762A|nr:2'-5' RNA ligase family protein [Modestobacter sp. DSM 44400]
MDTSRPASGLVVAVPEAEAVVGRHRDRLDDHAARGAPAHVTVLFPFVPGDAIDADVLARVAAVVGTVPSFGYSFSDTAWFDDAVLWLAPDDPAPFRNLTECVFAAFPAHPPFEGEFDDVVPHLTVGHRHPRPVLEAAERQVRPLLPVAGTAHEVVLLAEDLPGGRWASRASFPLG